ncbi:MAG: putative transmembrane transporter [Stygiobacter sp.]|nr:MAG: putative transmembrane transporter [Stygiobacter sp.]KAF0215648.1 MAG: putative transmembrane protein [Ignavibacteria bacterium]
MFNELLFLLVLLLLSAFFSSSEIAFIVSNKIKIELRARKKYLMALNAKYFVHNPDIFFSTILISNNIVNISFASLSSVVLLELFGLSELQILLVSTLLLLVIGELIPKFVGRELADSLVLFSSIPIRIITIVLFPIAKLTSTISSVLSRTNLKEEEEILQIVNKEDLQDLLEESSEAGKMDEAQSDIISKVIDIREQRVYEAMTPRTDVIGVDLTFTMEEVLDTFIQSGYSKILVYDENLDNIKGWLFTKDIFKQPADWKTIVRDVLFVPETKKSLEMLNEFLSKQISVAVVVDEFGGTAGLITVEDLIEELFGEIRDEYDEAEEKMIRKVQGNAFVLSGKVEIDILNEEHDLKIPEGDYETIAGFIMYKIGRIPVKGESFKIDNFTIMILRSDKTKIDLVKLTAEQNNPE